MKPRIQSFAARCCYNCGQPPHVAIATTINHQLFPCATANPINCPPPSSTTPCLFASSFSSHSLFFLLLPFLLIPSCFFFFLIFSFSLLFSSPPLFFPFRHHFFHFREMGVIPFLGFLTVIVRCESFTI